MKKLLDKFKSWLHRIGLLTVFPKPTKKAKRWAEKNTRFNNPQSRYEHQMYTFAIGLHSAALHRGLQPDSDDYFDYIDQEIRKAFPAYGWEHIND